jgi:hypothetical protein
MCTRITGGSSPCRVSGPTALLASVGLLVTPSTALATSDNPQNGSAPAFVPNGPDLDGSGIVDFNDLVMLLTVIGNPAAANPAWVTAADLNDDGVIDFADLSVLLSSFGQMIPPPPPAPPPSENPPPPEPEDPGEPPAPENPPATGPVLDVGTGFWGPTVVAPVVGDPNAPGADAKAIARWNVVPFQTITGEFKVGVVAFHINGIERVSFSADGGEWVDVTEMTHNDRTDTYEYWVTLDASQMEDGPVELRAVAYPTDGVPRVLAGEIERSTVGNGTHSLVLFANAGGSMPEPIAYVSGSGSDETGDGSMENPYLTFSQAIRSRMRPGSESAGLTIRCLPGDYIYGRIGAHFRTNSVDGRWVTIEAAPGVAREDVRITSTLTGGLASQKIRLRNLTIVGNRRMVSDRFWFDRVEFLGAGLDQNYKVFSPAWSPHGIYVTDSVAGNYRNGVRDAHFIRGTRVTTNSGSPFGGSPMTVNSHCDEYIYTGFHGDVFHWLAFPDSNPDANVIVYNVSAPRFPTQGIFAEVLGGTRFDNVAIVNLLTVKGDLGSAGSWWETDTNHLLMWGVTMPDQLMRFAQNDYNTSVSNVSIKGTIVRAFSHTRLPGDTRAVGVHVTDPNVYGAWWPVSQDQTTFGDPMFMNPAAFDFRPAPNSPLVGRIQNGQGNLVIDAMNNRRAEQTAAGALASAAESDNQ